MLLAPPRDDRAKDDDPLTIAAALFKIDTTGLRPVWPKRSKRKAGKGQENRKSMRSQSLKRTSLASEMTVKWGCPFL